MANFGIADQGIMGAANPTSFAQGSTGMAPAQPAPQPAPAPGVQGAEMGGIDPTKVNAVIQAAGDALNSWKTMKTATRSEYTPEFEAKASQLRADRVWQAATAMADKVNLSPQEYQLVYKQIMGSGIGPGSGYGDEYLASKQVGGPAPEPTSTAFGAVKKNGEWFGDVKSVPMLNALGQFKKSLDPNDPESQQLALVSDLVQGNATGEVSDSDMIAKAGDKFNTWESRFNMFLDQNAPQKVPTNETGTSPAANPSAEPGAAPAAPYGRTQATGQAQAPIKAPMQMAMANMAQPGQSDYDRLVAERQQIYGNPSVFRTAIGQQRIKDIDAELARVQTAALRPAGGGRGSMQERLATRANRDAVLKDIDAAEDDGKIDSGTANSLRSLAGMSPYDASQRLGQLGIRTSPGLISFEIKKRQMVEEATRAGKTETAAALQQAKDEVELNNIAKKEEAKATGERAATLKVAFSPVSAMIDAWMSAPAKGPLGGAFYEAYGLPLERLQDKSPAEVERAVAESAAKFSTVARGVQGEKGVLSDQDVARAASSFPTFKDSPQQRRQKLIAMTQVFVDRGVPGAKELMSKIKAWTPPQGEGIKGSVTPVPAPSDSGSTKAQQYLDEVRRIKGGK